MKMIVKKRVDMSYRNTPLHNDYSPAQLSVGCKLKTRVHCHSNELKPQLPDNNLVQEKEKANLDKVKANYDQRYRFVQSRNPFLRDRVWIPDFKQGGNSNKIREIPSVSCH